MEFDRSLARLLLEVCRYTYAVNFDSAAAEGRDALDYIRTNGALVGKPIVLQDDEDVPTSVASIVRFEDKTVVAYMGTKTEFSTLLNSLASIRDWVQNVRAGLVPFRLSGRHLGDPLAPDVELPCLAHQGFLSELRLIQAQVVKRLRTEHPASLPLYVTGHSQGGAEAALATAALPLAGFEITETYTFAAPRPGDAALRALVRTPVHRVEFGDDIVPHLAPLFADVAIADIVSILVAECGLASLFERELEQASALAAQLGIAHRLDFGFHFGPRISKLVDRFDDHAFVGIGPLSYADPKRPMLVDLDHSAELGLFHARLERLKSAGRNLFEHHHLRGTAEDVAAHRLGNYTGMVSQ